MKAIPNMRISLAFTALAIVLPINASAHTVWIGASQYHVEAEPEGKPASTNLYFGWGDIPPVQDFLTDRSRIVQFTIRDPSGGTHDIEPGPSGYRAVSVPLPAPGTYIAATAIKPYYHSYWEDKGKVASGSIARSAAPPGARVYESQLRKIFGKTVLSVGPVVTDDEGYKRPVGHELEIIPLVNPASLKPGDALPFQILLNGRPLNLRRQERRPQIFANYVGFSQREEYPWMGEIGEDGQGRLPLRNAGIWQLRVEQSIPLYPPDDRYARETILKANLMFEVR